MSVLVGPNPNNMKLNIGKINVKISGLELQRKKIFENIIQLKRARDKLISELRTYNVNQGPNEKSKHDISENSTNCVNNEFVVDSFPNNHNFEDLSDSFVPDESDAILISDDEDIVMEDTTFPKNDALSHGEVLKVDSKSLVVDNSVSKCDTLNPKITGVIAETRSRSPCPPPVFAKPKIPPAKPKNKHVKHFEEHHIRGNHKATKPLNAVANFNKAKYRLLRPSGRRGALVKGKLIDDVKFVNKDPIMYRGTGWKNKGDVGLGVFVLTGSHDQEKQAVQPVHMDGQAQVTEEGKVLFKGQLYSQYSQSQFYST